MDEETRSRLSELERIIRDTARAAQENAIATERAAADARTARDAAHEARPLVLARSGDEQRREKFELNVDQAHDKIREHSVRIGGLEKWKERLVWIAAGLALAAQAGWWIVTKLLDKALD